MQMNKLGGMDIVVSAVGLGTVKFGRNQGVKYPASFELPSDHEVDELLGCAAEVGINLLDTAPAYGSSEQRLGKLLKNQRNNWILSTKVGESFIDGQSHFDFSASTVRKSIENSLRLLHTDWLDIVLVHSNGEDEKIIEKDGVFEVLAALRQAGLIRAIGMSTKTLAGGLQTVALADVVMVAPEDAEVIAAAHQQKKGVFIKKALASGHLDKTARDPVQQAMDLIFAMPGVSSVIVGTLSHAHLRHDVACALQALQRGV